MVETGGDQPVHLMAVFAHPDDESWAAGGALVEARRRGLAAMVVCATRGEVGSRGTPPVCSHEALPRVRSAELRCAVEVLGVPQLRFLGYRDGRLDRAEPEDVAERIVRLVRTHRPQVLVGMETGGITGHPDHVALAQALRIAFDWSADRNRFVTFPAHDLPPHQPVRLFEYAVPESVARMAGDIVSFIPDGSADCAYDLDDEQRSLQARALLECHRTQRGGIGPELEAWLRDAPRRDNWLLARSAAGAPTASATDLFAGLGLPIAVG
ncbi:MAG: PIG-L deacetylase family protein [Candidatus Dormibacteria bacterium]